jgi:hypothetical protein
LRAADYSDYKDYSDYSDKQNTPSGPPFEEIKEGQPPTSSLAQPNFQPENEDEVLLLMPEEKKCPICGSIVWRVRLEVYDKGSGEAVCAKCWRSTYFESFDGGDSLYSVRTK